MARAHGARRLQVGILHDGERRPADHPGPARGDQQRQGQDEVQEPRPEHRHERQDDDQVGERHPGVDDALHDDVVGPADIGARDAHGRGDQGAEDDRRKAHRHRDARAVDDAAPHVAREVVGAHPEPGARRLHARAGNALVIGIVGDDVRARGHHEHGEDAQSPEGAERLPSAKAQQTGHGARQAPGPVGERLGGRDGFNPVGHG
jgi:hypothetical protein